LTRFHGEEEPEKSELPALQIIRRSFQLPSGTGNIPKINQITRFYEWKIPPSEKVT
jgi:hypothetical protein